MNTKADKKTILSTQNIIELLKRSLKNFFYGKEDDSTQHTQNLKSCFGHEREILQRR